MRRALVAIAGFFALVCLPAHAVDIYARYNGNCMQGGSPVTVNGIQSNQLVMLSFVGSTCQATVFIHGTLTPASIFTDAAGLFPLANPFSATSTGIAAWYAADGRYDVQYSGTAIVSPFTISDIGICFSCTGGVGTVTNFSAGTLSPLFTTSVATSTTTPALTFSLSTAAGHSWFGNNTGSSAAPGYETIGTGDLPFTYTGNTTKLATSTGLLTTGHCIQIDANGNFVDSGGVCGGGGGGSPASPVGSLQFNNSGSFGSVTSVAAGSQYASNGTLVPPITQLKPVIDVRDLGVDCSGNLASAAANDAALAALTGNPPTTNDKITGRTVIFPVAPNGTVCFVAHQNTWLIKNQTSFVIDFQGRGGNAASAGLLYCVTGGTCNGGPQINIEYSSGFEIRGGYIDGHNLAAEGIRIDKDGSGGSYSTTDGYIHDMEIAAGPSATQAYIGVNISPISTANVEDMKIFRTNFGCHTSPTNAVATTGIHIGPSQNAKNERFEDNQFTNCLNAIWKENGSMTVRGSEFRANGGTCGSGIGADIRDDANTDPDVIEWNLDEIGSQFFQCSGDSGSCNLSNPVSINHNNFSPFGCENLASYWITTGPGQPTFEFRNNHFDSDNNLVKLIGTVNAGFQQHIFQSGNNFPNFAFTLPWLNGAQDRFDDMGVIVGSQILAPVTNASAATYSSPFLAFRSYLVSHANADDFALQTVGNVAGTPTTFLVKHQQGTAGAMISLDGALPTLTVSPLGTPQTPTVNSQGTTGATTYTYAVVAYASSQNSAGSATGSTAVGNATLTTSNFNQLQFQGLTGATQYCIWRTVGGATQGKIGCISAIQQRNSPTSSTYGLAAGTGYPTNQVPSSNFYFFNDTGLAGDSTSLPATNVTGQIVSTVSTGLAPFAVTSTTQVSNLNVSQLEGKTWEAPGTIGSTTPSTGAFTTISATSQITSTQTTGTAPFSITSTTPVANLTTVPTTYNHSGTQATATHIVQDRCTLGTSCSVTLTGSAVYTSSSTYDCVAIDRTGANAIQFAPSSGSAFALTGTGTDTLSYICVGN